MYGLKINNLIYSDVKYMLSHKIMAGEGFTKYTGAIHGDILTLPLSEFRQINVGQAGNIKIFVKKKSKFTRSTKFLYDGRLANFSGVVGKDMCYLERRGADIYIICLNPKDWEFLIYKKCSLFSDINRGFGINVYNENGVCTYTSNKEPCILSSILDLNTLFGVATNVAFPHIAWDFPWERGATYNGLFELTQNKIIKKNSYIELGVGAFFYADWSPKGGYDHSHDRCIYSLLIDSTGEVRFVPTIGYSWGVNDHYYMGGGATSLKSNIYKSCTHTGVISI